MRIALLCLGLLAATAIADVILEGKGADVHWNTGVGAQATLINTHNSPHYWAKVNLVSVTEVTSSGSVKRQVNMPRENVSCPETPVFLMYQGNNNLTLEQCKTEASNQTSNAGGAMISFSSVQYSLEIPATAMNPVAVEDNTVKFSFAVDQWPHNVDDDGNVIQFRIILTASGDIDTNFNVTSENVKATYATYYKTNVTYGDASAIFLGTDQTMLNVSVSEEYFNAVELLFTSVLSTSGYQTANTESASFMLSANVLPHHSKKIDGFGEFIVGGVLACFGIMGIAFFATRNCNKAQSAGYSNVQDREVVAKEVQIQLRDDKSNNGASAYRAANE
jgi:hypothetical protein